MPDQTEAAGREPWLVEPANSQRVAMDAIELSLTLQAAVARRHLDLPLGEIMQPLPTVGPRLIEPAAFLRVTQIGELLPGAAGDPLTALQNILTACHASGRFTLIFALASDGRQNSIYLGARSHDSGSSAAGFLRAIADFLEANWPGTRLTPIDRDDETFLRMVKQPLRAEASTCAVALTGVPSLKAGEARGYPQTLDRLLNGMRGKPFLYLVLADPIPGDEVDHMVYRCRDLISQVHVMAKSALTVTGALQETRTSGTSVGVSAGQSSAETAGTSRTQAESLRLIEDLKQYFHLGRPGAHRTETTSTTTTESWTSSANVNEAIALAVSSGMNVGREHINTHAQAVEAHLEQHVHRLEQARALGCWSTGFYAVAEREDLAQAVGMQIRALLTGRESLYEPIRIHALHAFKKDLQDPLASFSKPNAGVIRPEARARETLSAADRVEHLLGPHFSGLTTPLNTEELAILVNLPQREVAGIPLAPTASFSLNVARAEEGDIVIGRLIDGGRVTTSPYPVPLRTLAKHTLVAGTTGSGKSTTCRHVLTSLHERGIPFLVIEPAKDEYAHWAMRRNEAFPPGDPRRIRVYMPGGRSVRGQPLHDQLVINPLDLIQLPEGPAPSVLSHVDRLKSILNAAFPMQEALPILLEDVLFEVYSKPVNWLGDDEPPLGSTRPTLRQMTDTVRTVVRQKGYEERVTANLAAALTTRLQSLRRGWKGALFDQAESTPWAHLFDSPAVINLSQLGDEGDRSFAMAVILQFLFEYRQAQFDAGVSARNQPPTLQHLTVVEEAHRVLRASPAVSVSEASPQAKVAQMFSDALSEMRAYGEGLLIVDQVPARLVADAVKNTNTKVVHRIVADDDRTAMSNCMTLTAEQSALMPRLRVGHAIVFGDQDDRAAWIQMT